MTRASYRRAVQWIAENEDTDWALPENEGFGISVTAALVCDLFEVPDEKLLKDVRRALKRY